MGDHDYSGVSAFLLRRLSLLMDQQEQGVSPVPCPNRDCQEKPPDQQYRLLLPGSQPGLETDPARIQSALPIEHFLARQDGSAESEQTQEGQIIRCPGSCAQFGLPGVQSASDGRLLPVHPTDHPFALHQLSGQVPGKSIAAPEVCDLHPGLLQPVPPGLLSRCRLLPSASPATDGHPLETRQGHPQQESLRTAPTSHLPATTRPDPPRHLRHHDRIALRLPAEPQRDQGVRECACRGASDSRLSRLWPVFPGALVPDGAAVPDEHLRLVASPGVEPSPVLLRDQLQHNAAQTQPRPELQPRPLPD